LVNAIGDALTAEAGPSPPVAYLAYHDTLEPDARLRPAPNVWFEWAPRERCYSHAIDDPACETNPRYLESLKRYLELFDGRGHVLEYYADAILFGGLGLATPRVIVSDLRAYCALGLASISCLTFGAYSALSYPVNLETYARATRTPDFEPGQVLADTAALLHPACAAQMARAYRAIAEASVMILNGGGDVMRPQRRQDAPHQRRRELDASVAAISRALDAADYILEARDDGLLVRAEGGVWRYSREVVSGMADYLAAAHESGVERVRMGEAAIKKMDEALGHIREVDTSAKGTWGALDLEHFSRNWLEAMRWRLHRQPARE
jgi:hypothetical protein